MIPILTPVLDKVADASISLPEDVLDQLSATSVLLEPHLHDEPTIVSALELLERADQAIMRRWRVYECGALVKSNAQDIKTSHEGFEPQVLAYCTLSMALKAVHDQLLNATEDKVILGIWNANKSEMMRVEKELQCLTEQFKKSPALRVCCSKRSNTSFEQMLQTYLHCLVRPLPGGLETWLSEYNGILDHPRQGIKIDKSFNSAWLDRRVGVPVRAARDKLLEITQFVSSALSISWEDHWVPATCGGQFQPIHLKNICRAVEDRIGLFTELAEQFVSVRLAVREKSATVEMQGVLQAALEAVEAPMDWQVPADELYAFAQVADVVSCFDGAVQDGLLPFFQAGRALNRQVLGEHWEGMFKHISELRVQAVTNTEQLTYYGTATFLTFVTWTLVSAFNSLRSVVLCLLELSMSSGPLVCCEGLLMRAEFQHTNLSWSRQGVLL